jgi:hypothetical protein
MSQELAIKKVTHVLVENVPQLPKLCFDPCAVSGTISEALREADRMARDSGIQWGLNCQTDATTPDFWSYWTQHMGRMASAKRTPWATITYPPFDLASKILPLAYEHSPWGVAFLLKLDYLEPHGDWLIEHADSLRHIIAVNPVHCLPGDAYRSASVAWMVWQKSWSWKQLGIRCPFIFELGGNNEQY